ncbi:hypothetical protein ACFE04_019455 [Oxalis oulophora]
MICTKSNLFQILQKYGHVMAIPPDSNVKVEDVKSSCEYHSGQKGHSIESCNEFDAKLMKLHREKWFTIKSRTREVRINMTGCPKLNSKDDEPLVILYDLISSSNMTSLIKPTIINTPSPFPYKSETVVPWMYEKLSANKEEDGGSEKEKCYALIVKDLEKPVPDVLTRALLSTDQMLVMQEKIMAIEDIPETSFVAKERKTLNSQSIYPIRYDPKK